jgi:peptidoglycan/xylan/chitin deacetylase (PgdA/CDA1 family)
MFQAHVDRLRSDGLRGLSTGEALSREGDSRCVAITFDDGSETDLLAAAPVLREAGFGATFYVTVDHLGRRGFLSKSQLRELAELGFEVGSHAMKHRYLHDLPTPEVRAELVDSKRELEDVTGGCVVQFSCPGGRWDRRVLQMAREAGYESLVTSAIGMNSRRSDRFRLNRIPVMRGMEATEVARLARGVGVTRRRAQSAILNLAKRLLGNSTYDRLRSRALRRDGASR